MIKSLVLFFRKRNIRKNMQDRRMMRFPHIDKFPVISILIDDGQKDNIKEIELFVKNSFAPKMLRFIILADGLPDNQLQSDSRLFLLKEDFNKLGLLKKEKEESLKSFSDDIFINLSDNNNDMLNDYIISYIRSSFMIGHSLVNMKIHDLVIDYGMEKNAVERLKILYRYLLMLSGNKNEK